MESPFVIDGVFSIVPAAVSYGLPEKPTLRNASHRLLSRNAAFESTQRNPVQLENKECVMSKVYPIEDAVPPPPDEDEKKPEKKVLTKDEKIEKEKKELLSSVAAADFSSFVVVN